MGLKVLFCFLFLIDLINGFDTSIYTCQSNNYNLADTNLLELENGCTLYNSTQFLDYTKLYLIDSLIVDSEQDCCKYCQSDSCDFFLVQSYYVASLLQKSCNFYKISVPELFLCSVSGLMLGMPATKI
jgi:hypothetical protein